MKRKEVLDFAEFASFLDNGRGGQRNWLQDGLFRHWANRGSVSGHLRGRSDRWEENSVHWGGKDGGNQNETDFAVRFKRTCVGGGSEGKGDLASGTRLECRKDADMKKGTYGLKEGEQLPDVVKRERVREYKVDGVSGGKGTYGKIWGADWLWGRLLIICGTLHREGKSPA